MTEMLAGLYDKVTAFEIDTDLIPLLKKTLDGHSNVEVINKDILEVDLKKYIDDQRRRAEGGSAGADRQGV